nr:pyruvate decarboxylase [Phaffia rhodozyma]AEN14644.1 pyruvate decarboxylase [Phaffia rhodozyma]
MPAAYPDQISISEYLLARLNQLKVKTIFGVPGDFNLEFLDYIEASPDFTWAGNANELNASYAADGYARVSKGLAVLVTTFGVGELSALCGVAGMMSERLPLLHIVGVPNNKLQSQKALLHHTLGDGGFNEFEDMSAKISAHTGKLTRAENAGQIIDDLIKVALRECRPVYLTFPTDLFHVKISSAALNTELPTPLSAPFVCPPLDTIKTTPAVEDVLNKVVQMYKDSVDPIVLVDACASRFGMERAVQELVEKTDMTFYETPMGKATMDETHPNYGGCYIGANSLPSVRQLVEKADLVLSMGALLSDFNTGSFSYSLDSSRVVELHSDHVKIGYATYPGISFRDVLPHLIEKLGQFPAKKGSDAANKAEGEAAEQRKEAVEVPNTTDDSEDDKRFGKTTITQKHLWPRLGKFLQEYDVVIAETGTSAFGVLDIPYPKNAVALAQVLWGAIGWSVGATLGAAAAARESAQPDRRTILFVGDGSLQLTIQEIGTMLRRGLSPYIFVLNNDGYEIERQIHGVKAVYNDIQPYNHSLILDLFAGPPKEGQALKHKFHKVATRDELDALLNNKEFQSGNVLNLIEVMMPRDDAPRALLTQAELTSNANSS